MNHPVLPVHFGRGRSSGLRYAYCPLCLTPLPATTRDGAMTELCRHMNQAHYSPPRGNA